MRAGSDSYSRYQENKDIINLGVYQKGADRYIDEAIAYQPKLAHFLRQEQTQAVSLQDSMLQLENLFGEQAQGQRVSAA